MAAPVLILNHDVKSWEGCVRSTGLDHGVGTGAHEVVVLLVKCLVMRVTQGPACGTGLGHTNWAVIDDLAGFLLPALSRTTGRLGRKLRN